MSVKFVSPSVVVTRLQASDSKKPPSQDQEQDIPSAEMGRGATLSDYCAASHHQGRPFYQVIKDWQKSI